MSHTIDVEQDGTVEFVKHPDQPFISQSFNGKTVYLCTVMATQEDVERVVSLLTGLVSMLSPEVKDEFKDFPKIIT